MSRLGALALSALLLAAARGARADPFHAQTIPLGQRAIGMGGAFTAVADDPSCTYYNPAGITLTTNSSLSASLTLTAFDRTTVERGYRTNAGTAELRHDKGTSLPVFVAAVHHAGRRDDEGRRAHAIAFSTFTVSQRRTSFDVQALTRDPVARNSFDTLSIESGDRTVWSGGSYAYRLAPSLSLGVSAFLSITRTHHTEERIGALFGNVNPDGSFAAESTVFRHHVIDSNIKSFVFRLGALYILDEQLRFGMMFQPGSLHVRGRARVRERRIRAQIDDDTSEASLFHASDGEVAAARPFPWELRSGVSYRPKHWLTLALDASVYGKSGSARAPVSALGPRSIDPTSGARPSLGAFATDSWYRTYNANLSLGGEAILKDSIAIRGGLYTDFSSAPEVPRRSALYTPPDVHHVGGAFSVGLISDGYDLSVGAIGVLGRGHALAFDPDPALAEPYTRTAVRDRILLVFLNGVKNAVRSLAKRAAEKIRSVREELESEPEAQPEPTD